MEFTTVFKGRLIDLKLQINKGRNINNFLQVFIISWTGQHENAIHIANQISSRVKDVFIVYSDCNENINLETACHQIRCSNNLYWEDKFKACIESSEDNVALIIHADCKCESWDLLIERCIHAHNKFSDIGVWSPDIEGTPYALNFTKLKKINHSKFNLVTFTDSIIFSLHPEIIKKMKLLNLNNNKYGWGIGLTFCAISHITSRLVLIDEEIKVNHPDTRGYCSNSAFAGMENFINQLPVAQKIIIKIFSKLHSLRKKNINSVINLIYLRFIIQIFSIIKLIKCIRYRK